MSDKLTVKVPVANEDPLLFLEEAKKAINFNSANIDAILEVLNRKGWDDLRFPATGDRLNSSSSRYNFDYVNIGINFDANARYDQERLAYIAQMQHKWWQGSAIRPHMHWEQNQNAVPNWLLEWRKYRNGHSVTAWTEVTPIAEAFTYASGSIMQISIFPEIDMSEMRISDIVECRISRDTTAGSNVYTGADPYTGTALYKEYDIHYRADSSGSIEEYTKQP